VDAADLPVSALASIETLNGLSRAAFAEALRPLFEAATPLADALYAARPFSSYAALLDAAESIVLHLSGPDQVTVINAHPRIGERPELVSEASYREQGYAAERGAEVGHVYRELAELNRAYEERFGFRFVVFVNGRPKAEIVDVLKGRMSHGRDEEMQTALMDMVAIARDRLRAASA
jgi:OHCU decarboxylase